MPLPQTSCSHPVGVTLAVARHLIFPLSAFGTVIEGIEAVDHICSVRTDWNDKPRIPQVMKRVTVETFGVDYPEPEKC